MEAKQNTYVGVEFNDAEIRVATVSLRGHKFLSTQVASAPMPTGAFVRGFVQQPELIADAVRSLCQSIGVPSGSKVVFGVSGEHVAVRILPVPPVPDDELPIIVAGEVDHFGLVRSAGGTHAYFKFVVPPRMGETPLTNVVIMGIEADINGPFLQIADRLGMEVEGVEPTPLASLRTALTYLGSRGGGLVVIVGKASTDIVPVVEGALIGYRRIESGAKSVSFTAPRGDAAPAQPEAQTFNVELRRTIEFYRREYPHLPTADKIVLCIEDDSVETLGQELAATTGVETVVLKPSDAGWSVSGATPRFVAAAGLALHGGPSAHGLPKVDFFARQRVATMQTAVKRNFAGSIAVSALALLLGGAMYFLYQQQIDSRQAEVKRMQGRSSKVVQEVDAIKAERNLRETQLVALRRDGIPLNVIVEYVVAAVGPNIGLTSITTTPDLKVNIAGEAADESSMLTMISNLQSCPVIKDVRVTSFSRPNPPVGNIVNFQLSGSTVTLDRIKTRPRLKEAK